MTSLIKSSFIISLFVALASLSACNETFTPRPRGYFRIALPEKSYVNYTTRCDFSADLPVYSKVEIVKTSSDSCWYNIVLPEFKAKIHCTYLPVSEGIEGLVEDAYNFAFKHEMKANAITRMPFHSDSTDVHGIIYDLKGNVASPIQFFATDSTNHFLRGALYFNHRPNADSIGPVQDFIREDILHMMQTIKWEQ